MAKRYSNTSSVPLSLAVFLATDYYDHNDDPNTISVTTLIKPVRQIVLGRRIDPSSMTLDLVSQMSNRLGASIHDGIERAWKTNYHAALESLGIPKHVIDLIRINPTDEELAANPDILPVYMEQRMQKKIGKWIVTGKFDFIGEGRVQDFKTASVWSYMEQVNAEKQIMQGSLYRWLDPKKITQDQMDIIHIYMDWRASAAKTDPKYPPQRFHTQTFNLWSVTETEYYVKRKLVEIDRFMDADDADIPECPDDDLWTSDPKFKYYKNGDINSARSTKNFDTMRDAQNYMYGEGKGVGAIKEVPGEVRACKFCSAAPICQQKDRLIAAGRLTMV